MNNYQKSLAAVISEGGYRFAAGALSICFDTTEASEQARR
jgi:hypothetical protein